MKVAMKKVADKQEAILVDSKGLTLYYFTPDRGGTVTCTGACLQARPPHGHQSAPGGTGA
jgi:predicted lipoprotein with Yx(FWY)xxD motif